MAQTLKPAPPSAYADHHKSAMDSIRVAKVDDVVYTKAKSRIKGTLHLTAHHLIFKPIDNEEEKEVWTPYPLISTVARIPQSLQGLSPLAFRLRTFDNFTLTFSKDRSAIDVFESVKELTVASSVYNMYAFFYEPSPPLSEKLGWTLYSPRDEFTRMGVGSRTKAWRFTDINKDYSLCATYPGRLVVPARISDSTLAYGAKYRSKARIPALVYLHWNNHASITRSSQPTVGLTNSRSIQDEKMVEAIFQSHHLFSSPFASPPPKASSAVYGATATNLIIDARSATSGVANVARGGGTENMDYYRDGRKAYLGVENIHVMRDSLVKVAQALRDADAMLPLSETDKAQSSGIIDRQALRASGWLKHISALIDGASIVVRNIHVNSSHVLIHCSDGWDRTAQLSTLAQICLDPYYRTFRGFQVLVEKDWVSFGHRFLDRCGHLSSEKFFLTPSSDGATDSGGPQAFFASVQNKFASPSHLKETSPVFHQFLECVQNIMRQNPTRFEFNDRFLERLHYHLYSCQFGTFLFNNERERRVAVDGQRTAAWHRTQSVWDLMNSDPQSQGIFNELYDTSLDARDHAQERRGDMGVIVPDSQDVRFWHQLYGRNDEEMNGRTVTGRMRGVEVIGPVESELYDPVLPIDGDGAGLALADSFQSAKVLSIPEKEMPRLDNRALSSASPDRQSVNRSPISPSPSSSKSETHTFSARSAPIRRPPLALPFDTGAAAGSMKSLWEQLSSNASAAFSAVQDVYVEAIGDPGAPTTSRGSERELEVTQGSSSSSEIKKRGFTVDVHSSNPPLGDNPWSAEYKSKTNVTASPIRSTGDPAMSTSPLGPFLGTVSPRPSFSKVHSSDASSQTASPSQQLSDLTLDPASWSTGNSTESSEILLSDSTSELASSRFTESTSGMMSSKLTDSEVVIENIQANPHAQRRQELGLGAVSTAEPAKRPESIISEDFDPLGVGLTT